MLKINATTGGFEPSEDNVFETIEKYLKDDHVLLLADSDFRKYVEEKLYMKGNNEDYKIITGSFQGSLIFTFAIIKKTDDLRRFLGIDDNKKWDLLLCVIPGDIERISLYINGIYQIPYSQHCQR